VNCIILLLVALLFLQIEAANAGLMAVIKAELENFLTFSSLVFTFSLCFSLILVYYAFFDTSLNLKDEDQFKQGQN